MEATSVQIIAEACQPLVALATTVTESYGASLVNNPLPTKSLTAGVLCGISDVIAQNKNKKEDYKYNPQRTLRFASKGCLGGILWMFWYDRIDGFLAYSDVDVNADVNAAASSKISFYALAGAVLPPNANANFLAFAKDHTGAVTTGTSMVLEQFLWCPLVYGTFEIPVSTLMNGGRLDTIKGEIDKNLDGLLVANAKVWTLANLLIYNAPLEWRLFIGNVIDIFWQSIVSDVAADCGSGEGQEECDIPDDEFDDALDDVFSGVEERMVAAATMASAGSSTNENESSSSSINPRVPEPSVFGEKSRV